jgi:hypothetical protein
MKKRFCLLHLYFELLFEKRFEKRFGLRIHTCDKEPQNCLVPLLPPLPGPGTVALPLRHVSDASPLLQSRLLPQFAICLTRIFLKCGACVRVRWEGGRKEGDSGLGAVAFPAPLRVSQ